MSQLLQIRDASAHSGKTRLFSEISFSLKPGTLSCLIGPNGAGKSSVLRALAGIQPLSSGLIDIEGEPLCNLSSTHRARKIGYLPQTRPLAWPIRVRDVIALGRFAYGANTNRLTSDDEIAIDRAIQAHGAMGVCQDTFLADAWANVRTLRLADGPDEVHLDSIAKLELRKQAARRG